MVVKKSKRKSYHHGDLRRALIQAAAELLEDRQPGQVSLREVSERAGVSHAAAYRHFQDKAELFAAVSLEGFSRLRDELAGVRATQADAKADVQLQAMAEAYVAFAIAEPSTYRLMLGPHLMEQLEADGVATPATEAFGLVLKTVIAAQKAGVIRTGSPFLIAQTIWCMLHGLALFYLNGELGDDSSGSITGRVWRFLWEGLERRA